ncbi:hypothetical protein D3C81_1120230 [compost metagenome]
MALPYSFTPNCGYGSTTMSSSFTPRAFRFRIDVNEKPVMASRSPRVSMVSRSVGSIACQLNDWACRPLALAKIGKARRPASNTGAPSFLPVRSLGARMPDFFSASTAAGVLL